MYRVLIPALIAPALLVAFATFGNAQTKGDLPVGCVGGGQDLHGEFIINTQAFTTAWPFPGNAYAWTNPGPTKYVRSVSVWMGMDYGAIADLGMMLRRNSDQTYVLRQSWDHYAEPNGIHWNTYDFGLNHYRIDPGDGFTLNTWFQPFPQTPNAHAHIHITIRWTACP